jgi:tetratricopeptide (TPR) repeat protein
VIGWLLLAGMALSQSAIRAEEDFKETIQRAYQLTAKAATIDEYSEIIRLCGTAQQANLSEEQSNYVKSLLAWAHNRRGEVFTQQATEAYQVGQIQQASQLDAKALADFEASLQMDENRWKTWHNRAVSRAIAGKYQEAIDDFGKVIELKPDYVNAWFNRAEILYDLGKVEGAIENYTEAIRLNPQDAGAYSCRAHAYYRSGNTDLALADYQRAVELAPDDPDMLVNRGDAFQGLGKWVEAAEDFKAAIQRNSESPRALQSAAWLMATCPDPSVRNKDLAVQAAERAVQLNSQPDARFLDTLAAAYANAGRFDEAIAKIAEAIPLAPTDQATALKKRLELYKTKQPYRQSAGEKTAVTRKAKLTR